MLCFVEILERFMKCILWIAEHENREVLGENNEQYNLHEAEEDNLKATEHILDCSSGTKMCTATLITESKFPPGQLTNNYAVSLRFIPSTFSTLIPKWVTRLVNSIQI